MKSQVGFLLNFSVFNEKVSNFCYNIRMGKKILKIAFYLVLLSVVLWAIGVLMNEPKSQNSGLENIAINKK